jgi:putative hydrolase of the HAD superfamily
MGKITTIIFDIGQVLAAFDWLGYLDSMKLSPEKREKMVLATLHDLNHWDKHDRGVLTDEEFIQESVRKVPGIEKEMREFFKNIHQMVWEYDYSEQWVLEFKKAGYRVYILSNYGKTTFAYAKEHFKFLRHVDGMVISSDVHYVKPEPEIYRILLDKYQLVPEECVFMDDRADNAETAASFGIHAVQFKTREQVMEELERLGVRI